MGVARAPRRILVAGSGAREHALAWACLQHHPDLQVTCAPGNGGTAGFATNIAVAADDARGVARAARDSGAELVIVGPDGALAAGVADACMAAGIGVFGPSAAAARIESSKTFAKRLMESAGIPTARWCAGGADDRESLLVFAHELGGRCVVKADGLALGKGVVVCDDMHEVRSAIAACLDEQRFGSAGLQLLIEERLEGPEVSVLALTDSRTIRLLPPARDHKRIGDGDTGPNTGGMGAVTPPPGLGDDVIDDAHDILRACVDALSDAGTPFSGCLYAGLMLTADGPRVIEFNARFGDPETQVVLPIIDEDLLELLTACATGTLTSGSVRCADEGSAVGVVLAAEGYPGTPRRGEVISGLDTLDPGVLAFHAGTRRGDDGRLRTDGGRVLTLVARGDSIEAARQRVYAAVPSVHFDGMQYRRDIGITQAEPE